MTTPELKQFGDFDIEDLERHPVWIGCHTADYGKPWYEDTDEETFRPYRGKLPADPADGMFLVRAVFVLRDGGRTRVLSLRPLRDGTRGMTDAPCLSTTTS
jgi:hypothetical protein